MIDLSNETLISLADAARLLPPARLGRPVSFQCTLRWVTNGSRATDGGIVKLDAVRLGGRWVTSREALQRFAEALTAGRHPTSPEQRRRAAEPAGASRR